MIHSKWASGNPLFVVECSSIRISGSQGLWYSQNCNKKENVICAKQVHSQTVFGLPGLLQTTTGPFEGTTKTTIKEAKITDITTTMDQITTQTTYGGLLLSIYVYKVFRFYTIITTLPINE